MTIRPQSVGLAAAFVGAAIGVGYFATTDYAVIAAGGVLGLMLLGPLLRSARFRLFVVVAGALVAFQVGGDALKMGYLALALLCVGNALVRLNTRSEPEVRAFRPMLALAPVVIGYIGLSYVIASDFGAVPSDWFRDALPYLLVVILPVVGLDAAQDVSYSTLRKMAWWLGAVAGVALAFEWISRRGATESVGRFLLASDVFVLFAFCVALVCAATAVNRGRWFWATGFLAACLIVTGSRSNLAMLAVAGVGAIGATRKGRVPLGRMVGIGLGLLVVAGGAVLTLGAMFAPDTLAERWDLLVNVIDGNLAADQSYEIRSIAYDTVHDWWGLHMWFGGGPGHLYTVTTDYYELEQTFNLDTPWMTPAKFGIVGTGLLTAYLLAIVRGIRGTGGQPHPFYTVGRAFALLMIVRILFSPWLEDKGTALALTLLVAMAVAVGREQRLDRPPLAAVADDRDLLKRGQRHGRRPVDGLAR